MVLKVKFDPRKIIFRKGTKFEFYKNNFYYIFYYILLLLLLLHKIISKNY